MKTFRIVTILSLPIMLTACGMDATVDGSDDSELTTLETVSEVWALTADDAEAATEAPVEGEEPAATCGRRHHFGHDMFRLCSTLDKHERVLAEADTDGDGVLSEEERAAFKEAMAEKMEGEGERGHKGHKGGKRHKGGKGHKGPEGRQGHRGGPHLLGMLAKVYDADGDGELSDPEREELKADLEAGCEAQKDLLFARLDADGSGEISKEELEGAREAHKAKHEAKRAEIVEQYDADGDGRLSKDERHAAHEDREAVCGDHKEDLRFRFDTDGDGVLSDEEKAEMREALKQRVRNAGAPPAAEQAEGDETTE